jgi:ATP-dependent helicase/nuclease subunit B
MQARFLLGPAGGGKTFRCLAEIRDKLRSDPDGPPLVLLAPKQATYQLERQLLAEGSPSAYTSLRVLSFERLAEFVLEKLQAAPPRGLSQEGRIMVLRALLLRHADELSVFRTSARRAGFAQELSQVLSEIEQHRLTPGSLREIAAGRPPGDLLGMKLADLALLLEKRLDWLRDRGLSDTDRQIEFAADALRKARGAAGTGLPFRLGGVWLDGFAELTPGERWLLVCLAPFTSRVTLTFCIESDLREEPDWLSLWSPMARLYRQCLNDFGAAPEAEIEVEVLSRQLVETRFAESAALRRLESQWGREVGSPREPKPEAGGAVALFRAADPEAEAVVACREIRRFVRGGGRYRDAAILLRRLDGHAAILRRALTRYEIPYFLDQREPMAHHALAELTHYALRVVIHDWRAEDLFGAWKTGLFPVDESLVDEIENEGLERGWQGAIWRTGPPLTAGLDEAARGLAAPLEGFAARLASVDGVSGLELAGALGWLWRSLRVEASLAELDRRQKRTLHLTVWNGMEAWRENVSTAFGEQRLELREWESILQSGLAGLTAGAIPPALDQVLVGAIDRSRNPDLRLAIVLGMNEGLFPLAPPTPPLLTEFDRDALEAHQVNLSGNRRQFTSRERFLGYIACTRSRQRLVLCCAARDADGEAMNPSPFLSRAQGLFSGLDIVEAGENFGWEDAEHPGELLERALRDEGRFERGGPLSALLNLGAIEKLRRRVPAFRSADAAVALDPELVFRRFGGELRTSASALQQFAACPFQFFARQTLAGRERRLHEIDSREAGSFIHEILAAFHARIMESGRRWRDVPPAEARAIVREAAEKVSTRFRDGLLRAGAGSRLEAEVIIRQAEDFAEMETGLMSRYGFDPWKAELRFGGPKAEIAAWRIPLENGRAAVVEGKIDRVDLGPGGVAAVIDYKAGKSSYDEVLAWNGVAMQPLVYLNVLRHAPPEAGRPGFAPAGMFYAPLRPKSKRAARRGAPVPGAAPREEQWKAGQFRGRFAAGKLSLFDNQSHGPGRGTRFAFLVKKDGSISFATGDARPEAEFEGLMERNARLVRRFADRIYAGEAAVAPYAKGTARACDRCDLQAVCRVDIWTQSFRKLESPGAVSLACAAPAPPVIFARER